MSMERNGTNAVQSFKSKYPGAYDQYSDSELLTAIQKKHPGVYDDLAIQQAIPKSENVLQRVVKAVTSLSPQPANLQHPFQSGINATTQGLKQVPGLGGYMEGHEAKSRVINEAMPDNPVGAMATDFLSDPETLMGGKAAIEGAKGAYKSLRNPSKVFGEGIGKLQEANPTKKVDFLQILSNASSDPKASKVLEKSGALEKFGGSLLDEGGMTKEKLSNLTLQDSQDLVNMVKDGVRQAVKEGTVKSGERGIAKMFSELSKAQKSAFEGFDKVARNYGISKNVGKALTRTAKTAATGGALGLGGTLGHSFAKSMIK